MTGRWLGRWPLSALLLGLAAFSLLSFRLGWLPVQPAALALLVLLASLNLVAQLLRAIVALRRGSRSRVEAGGRVALLAGLLAVGLAGALNWARSLQGYVVLNEGQAVGLHGGRGLQEFEAGLLADPAELDLAVELLRVELRALPQERFLAEASLALRAGHAEVTPLRLSAQRAAAWRTLRFHLGSFGFVPHLIVERAGRTLLDRELPLRTRGPRQGRLRFAAELPLPDPRQGGAADSLEVEVLLQSLDARMRGHPSLGLLLRRGEAVIGQGTLLPGEAATLADGTKIRFAGLKRWIEIDVSRRNYRPFMLGGLTLAGMGAILWLFQALLRALGGRRSR